MKLIKRIAAACVSDSYIATMAIICIVCHLLFRFVFVPFQPIATIPLYISLGFGGSILIYQLVRKVIAREFGSDLLAGMSIVTAIILEEYLAGTLVVLMLSGGQTLEKYALSKASKALETLAKRAPTIAHRCLKGKIEDIQVHEIKPRDEILIYPHEICPVDGEVISGNGVMDESYLTGEPFHISKAPGSFVLSGAINGDVALHIVASKLPSDSRFAKIMQVMSESAQKRPKIRRLADTLGTWYTPLAILIALCAWVSSHDAVRFLAVLVIATPCPLLIAIPVAIIGTISLLAKIGVLIKDPVVLEQLSECRTMIFDKTGTLTLGKPQLVEETLWGDMTGNEILGLVASCEQYSKHPLSGALLEAAQKRKCTFSAVSHIAEPKGQGLTAVIEGKNIGVTSRKGLISIGLENELQKVKEGSGLECFIVIDGKLVAHYRFRDAPRLNSELFIKHLRPQHGFKKIMIVSGDRLEEVQYLADCVGIKEVFANKSPEEKVAIVEQETLLGKTAYVGDGINDAPALLAATVGIAFGQNSDITAEASGAVIMEDNLQKVDELLHVSRRMKVIALQSACGGMLLSIVGMAFAATGYLPPVAGAITQEIIDVVVILNALRTIGMPSILSDIPKTPIATPN